MPTTTDNSSPTTPQTRAPALSRRPQTATAGSEALLLQCVAEFLATQERTAALWMVRHVQDDSRASVEAHEAFVYETQDRQNELMIAVAKIPAQTVEGQLAKAKMIRSYYSVIDDNGEPNNNAYGEDEMLALSLANDLLAAT